MNKIVALLLPLWVAACDPVQLPADIQLPDGAVYDGDIEDNLFHGEGELTWPDGRQYRGEFQQGLMTGQGRLEDRDGCVMEGEFVQGVLHGEGSYVCDDARYHGRFEKGELFKGGVAYLDDNTYQGEFRHFQPHGKGVWSTASGEEFEGNFIDGYLEKGTYRNQEGLVYHGEFDWFSFEGKGELTRADGVVIKAQFENGYAEGKGVRIRPGDDGPVEEKGYFVSGRYYPSKQAYTERERELASGMEARLYTEASRLQSVLSSLAPQRPGVRDVYFLAVGGDGTAGVFSREVDWVSERLGGVLDLKRRQVKLVNGGGNEQPLATRTSVREALNALDGLMDPEEDLLLVHIVSHGTMNGELVLDARNLHLNNLTVEDGKHWLNALRVKHQWVVISACYSGQWVNALAAPQRAVFSSAAQDRTSFGCSDDSERTWFSRALYGEDMSAGIHDPDAWFAAANDRVTAMEVEQGIGEDDHSLPQKSVGQGFVRWWQSASLQAPQ
ncbi:C13 family peptidase [Alcanivorax sp. DP30]|uniref:C13 family peptidase n=1 Tax=Alcanivorax sp. DP30 TaxID=2606217 RepID=UPI001372067E|nr:C13 family peptidase [Alcanivorax sp. DP30]MZR64251.1 hypothetical protein [Alcanivorax sp. DP30]